MSRRRDRERFLANKKANPEYAGFRGYDKEPGMAGATAVVMTCSVCGRKRNLPAGVVVEDEGKYVCLSCQEEGRVPAEPQGG